MKHISHRLRKTRGRELPGTFDPMIVRDLFLKQYSPWEKLTRDHTNCIWGAAREFLALVVEYVTDETTSAAVIEDIIKPALASIKREIDKKTKELLLPHETGHPITYNHYFTETLQKMRAERQDEVAKTLQQFFGVVSLKDPYCGENSINLEQLLKSLLR